MGRCSWTAPSARPPQLGAGGEELGEGDQVVVERVSGLTLGVRKAEDWEDPC